MGKSAAEAILRRLGISVIDTDALARQLVQPGQPALAEIRSVFGADALSDSGGLKRDWLADRVFSDPTARQRLEAILHPRIRQAWKQQATEWDRAHVPLAVVVIPLLFETEAEKDADFVGTICVACSAETQRARLSERGWTSDQITARLAAQLAIEEKMARANYVVWNEASLSVLEDQLARILN